MARVGIPLRLPASMIGKEKAAFVGLGWSKMATTLAASSIDTEKEFLKVILDELNSEFALQLDTEPVLDRLVDTPEVSTSQTVIFAGVSHALRIAEAARSTYPEVVDLCIGGWKLNTESAAELAHDISGVLEDSEDTSFTTVLHLFNNSIFKGLLDGDLTEQFKQNGSYHIKGEMQLINSAELKHLFKTALPILRACSGANIILLGPLPCYINNKCCEDTSHITNFGTPDYIGTIANSIREMGKQLRNMTHIRRLKNTSTQSGGPDGGSRLHRGPPRQTAGAVQHSPSPPGGSRIRSIAARLTDELEKAHVVHVRLPSSSQASSSNSRPNKAAARESWTAGTPVVAHCKAHWADNRGHKGRGCGGFRGAG